MFPQKKLNTDMLSTLMESCKLQLINFLEIGWSCSKNVKKHYFARHNADKRIFEKITTLNIFAFFYVMLAIFLAPKCGGGGGSVTYGVDLN